MKSLARWYVVISVLVFTFCVPLWGRTPAGWTLSAASWLVSHAPRVNVGR